jgi:hypothetical protein
MLKKINGVFHVFINECTLPGKHCHFRWKDNHDKARHFEESVCEKCPKNYGEPDPSDDEHCCEAKFDSPTVGIDLGPEE